MAPTPPDQPTGDDATRHNEPLPEPAPDPDASRYDTVNFDADASRYGPAASPEITNPDATHYSNATIGQSRPGDPLPRIRRIGDYELLQELGRGGMGVVYKARDLKLNRLVALKMIRAGGHASDADLQRFLAEAQAVARLDHPYIVPIFEIGATDGLPFFAMALVEGGSLKQCLIDGPVPARVAARLLQQVAEGVQHAHEHGVIHRDLKPHNILLQYDDAGSAPGVTSRPGGATTQVASGPAPAAPARISGLSAPRVTDFGLARLIGEDGLTVTGDVMGTPSYMSPEQAAGRIREIGPESDVYGLGAVLYELLTGRPPFQAATPTETLRLVQDQEPVPPRRLNTGVPRDLQTICLKCLEKIPRRRYASAAELAADLGRFLGGEPVHAQPPTWTYLTRKFVNRYRVPLTAIALVLVLLVGGTVAAFVRIHRERQAALDANDKLVEQLYDNNIAVAERELTNNHDVNLASDLLEKCPDRLRGWEWDYLARLRDGGAPPVEGHEAGVFMAVFSPDDRLLATSSIDGTVKVWDAATRRLLSTYRGHSLLSFPVPGLPRIPVLCLAFSPDGKHIASGSFSPKLGKLRDSPGVVKVWEVETGRDVATFQNQVGAVLALTFSPDGKTIMSSSLNEDNTFVVWDAKTGEVVRVVSGHTSHVHRLRYSPDGRIFASVSEDGWVKLWDAATFQEIRSFHAHPAPVLDVSFSPDGARFATAGQDGTIRVWYTATGAAVMDPLRGHTGSALALAYSPDGKRIVSAGYDKTVRLWDAATGKLKITLRGHNDMVWGVSFSHDGRKVVSAAFDKTARIWDATPREEHGGPGLFTIKDHTERVNTVAFSRDGRYLASGSWDYTVKLWDGTTGEAIRTLSGHTAAVWCVAFSPDGKRLASASWDRTVKVWDTETGDELLTFTGHKAMVQTVAFSPDGKRVASGGLDAFVLIWDAATGKITTTCEGNLFPMASVAFSPHGKRIACGSTDRTVTVWDAETGNNLFTLRGHEGAIPSLCFSPDGKRLVTAGWDYVLKVWDVDPQRPVGLFQNRELMTLKGHTDQVNCVAISQDGTRIASAGEDKRVRVWDAQTGQEVMPALIHRGVVWGVAFSPDGQRLATGCWSPSGWVRTWDVSAKGNRD
jgi:eukaryotic-like serine/threonine-protein kinase